MNSMSTHMSTVLARTRSVLRLLACTAALAFVLGLPDTLYAATTVACNLL